MNKKLNIRINSNSLALLILLGSIVGFPLVAAVAELASINSTMISIFVRAFIALISIIFLLRFSRYSKSKKVIPIVALIIFSLLYISRIAYDFIFVNIPLGRPEYIFFIWFAGGCFLPAFALSGVSNKIEESEIIKFYKLFLWISPIVLLTILGTENFSFEAPGGYTVQTNRMGLKSLNPIFAGHFAVSVFIVAVYSFTLFKLNFFKLIALFALLIISFQVIIGSGSRGPLVAGILALLIIELGFFKLMFLFSVFLIIVTTGILPSIEEIPSALEGFAIFERLIGTLDTFSQGDGRIAQYSSAILLISESPLTGGYLEDPQFKIYPHNIILESIMAIGFLGGLILIYLMYHSVKTSILLLEKRPEFKALSILLIQYIIAAQFSGSIYTSTTMWVLIGFFCASRRLDFILVKRLN